jgi:hypothetical protein
VCVCVCVCVCECVWAEACWLCVGLLRTFNVRKGIADFGRLLSEMGYVAGSSKPSISSTAALGALEASHLLDVNGAKYFNVRSH